MTCCGGGVETATEDVCTRGRIIIFNSKSLNGGPTDELSDYQRLSSGFGQRAILWKQRYWHGSTCSTALLLMNKTAASQRKHRYGHTQTHTPTKETTIRLLELIRRYLSTPQYHCCCCGVWGLHSPASFTVNPTSCTPPMRQETGLGQWRSHWIRD